MQSGNFRWRPPSRTRLCRVRPAAGPSSRRRGVTCLVNSFFSSESLHSTCDQGSKCTQPTTEPCRRASLSRAHSPHRRDFRPCRWCRRSGKQRLLALTSSTAPPPLTLPTPEPVVHSVLALSIIHTLTCNTRAPGHVRLSALVYCSTSQSAPRKKRRPSPSPAVLFEGVIALDL